MTRLDLKNKGLTSLENIDLTGVTVLICYNNKLTSLPTLPEGITFLWCSSNYLTCLPILPKSLKHLDCANNKLTSLPILPESLHSLRCSKNNLASLPSLPDGLKSLACSHNNLCSLTITIPNTVEKLWCNQLPYLPSNIHFLCWFNKSYFDIEIDKIKLNQHNEMREDMGLPKVEQIEKSQEIRKQWIIWQYRLDGDKYKQAEQSIC